MNKLFDLEQFISTSVIEREHSLFEKDLARFEAELEERIEGKKALIIGGAGTIGSSFVKEMLKFKPAAMVVVDTNENGLTELVRDVRSTVGLNVPDHFITYPLNFADPVFKKIFNKQGPFDIIANFAAHKHVRSEKDQYSIEAMINNNVIAAKKLLDLVATQPPKHFFCVSTDKAANPVNIMGASKKLMEEMIMTYANQFPMTTARFANVAFSNGSLPFGFIERLMKRQPLSSPLDIKRYFVSPEESGQICLMACMLGKSGEIFFPKLKDVQMKTFSSIAEHLLKAMGLNPVYCRSEEEARSFLSNLPQESNDYPVYFFNSDTSGEKPYEEFFTGTEEVDNDRFHGLGVVTQRDELGLNDAKIMIDDLKSIFEREDVTKPLIVELLKKYLPNFGHIEKGKNLDQRM